MSCQLKMLKNIVEVLLKSWTISGFSVFFILMKLIIQFRRKYTILKFWTWIFVFVTDHQTFTFYLRYAPHRMHGSSRPLGPYSQSLLGKFLAKQAFYSSCFYMFCNKTFFMLWLTPKCSCYISYNRKIMFYYITH